MKIEVRTPNEDWGCALYKGAHYTPKNTVHVCACVCVCPRMYVHPCVCLCVCLHVCVCTQITMYLCVVLCAYMPCTGDAVPAPNSYSLPKLTGDKIVNKQAASSWTMTKRSQTGTDVVFCMGIQGSTQRGGGGFYPRGMQGSTQRGGGGGFYPRGMQRSRSACMVLPRVLPGGAASSSN